MQSMNLESCVTPYAKISSDVRAKITKLLDKNTIMNLHDIELGNGFLGMAPKETKKKYVNWTSSKINLFVFQRN